MLIKICRHNLSEFVKPISSKGLTIDDIYLTPDDFEMYIDLAPFVNPSPYVVPEDMSLSKVKTLHYLHCCLLPMSPIEHNVRVNSVIDGSGL